MSPASTLLCSPGQAGTQALLASLPTARNFRCVSPHLALISFLSDKITLLMSKTLEMLKTQGLPIETYSWLVLLARVRVWSLPLWFAEKAPFLLCICILSSPFIRTLVTSGWDCQLSLVKSIKLFPNKVPFLGIRLIEQTFWEGFKP